MKRKVLIIGATGVAIAMSLSACGSSKKSSSSGATIASKLILGGPPEFQTRVDGIPGLKNN